MAAAASSSSRGYDHRFKGAIEARVVACARVSRKSLGNTQSAPQSHWQASLE